MEKKNILEEIGKYLTILAIAYSAGTLGAQVHANADTLESIYQTLKDEIMHEAARSDEEGNDLRSDTEREFDHVWEDINELKEEVKELKKQLNELKNG